MALRLIVKELRHLVMVYVPNILKKVKDVRFGMLMTTNTLTMLWETNH